MSVVVKFALSSLRGTKSSRPLDLEWVVWGIVSVRSGEAGDWLHPRHTRAGAAPV